MRVKSVLVHVALTFGLTLVVGAVVSLLWSLIRHGSVSADWELSFRLAVIFGLVIPLAKGGYLGEKRSS